MVVNTRQRNTLQFQYFGVSQKCIWPSFSQLSFEIFWLYLLVEVAMTQKLLKKTQKYHLAQKVHELTV